MTGARPAYFSRIYASAKASRSGGACPRMDFSDGSAILRGGERADDRVARADARGNSGYSGRVQVLASIRVTMMLRKPVSALLLTAMLAVAALGSRPALAAQCYSSGQTRQMVQSGQAVSLSQVLGQIKAVGQIVSSDPLLCDVGGRLVYLVDVLAGGKVVHVQVDAQTGSINY